MSLLRKLESARARWRPLPRPRHRNPRAAHAPARRKERASGVETQNVKRTHFQGPTRTKCNRLYTPPNEPNQSGAGLLAFHEKATPCQVRNSVFVFFLRRRSFVLPGRQTCNDQACHSLISGPRCHRSRVPSRPSAATEGSKRAVGRSEEHTSELQ